MLRIETAEMGDYPGVLDFYWTLIQQMEKAEFQPGWKKDVYPTREFLLDSIQNRELYLGRAGGQLAACMVVNHAYNDGYRSVRWSVEADDSQLLVIHALGVLPGFSGRGIAAAMVQKAIETARASHIKTIRLDVLEGNLPAERAYIRAGFRYVDTIQMYYEDTGRTSFKVFELVL